MCAFCIEIATMIARFRPLGRLTCGFRNLRRDVHRAVLRRNRRAVPTRQRGQEHQGVTGPGARAVASVAPGQVLHSWCVGLDGVPKRARRGRGSALPADVLRAIDELLVADAAAKPAAVLASLLARFALDPSLHLKVKARVSQAKNQLKKREDAL